MPIAVEFVQWGPPSAQPRPQRPHGGGRRTPHLALDALEDGSPLADHVEEKEDVAYGVVDHVEEKEAVVDHVEKKEGVVDHVEGKEGVAGSWKWTRSWLILWAGLKASSQ